MKKNIIHSLWLTLAYLSAAGQSVSYNLTTVPEAIKNKASVITHFENIDIEVESLDKITLSVHRIFTVVNEEGKSALVFNENSSKRDGKKSISSKIP